MVRVGLALCLAAAGCHNDPCYEAGFDEGERFQFTMLDVQKRLLGPADAQPNPCDELPLAAGDTFILVGGSGRARQDRACVRFIALMRSEPRDA